MLTPDTTEAEHHSRREPEPSADCITLSTYLEFLAGGATVAVVFLFAMPILVELANPLGVLSTTALVFLFIFAWFSVWVLIRVTQEQMPSHS
ncbi:hypothetical protein [Halobellus sp. H-GB7]|uniref:hypothetical protein n=1 Tax=Halobellus sp. H-GB7 TaxID=3069756 RepID=UPI0027AE3965|nr:hypothetical protein [Halobellus sp. H-GB7]MDQ2053941.1 hypothetical protein [Halobellus sp. H-GB7]